MTPADFKQARIALGLSQKALAREWGMGQNGDRTIRLWESGDRPVNPIAAYCLQMMEKRNANDSSRQQNQA